MRTFLAAAAIVGMASAAWAADSSARLSQTLQLPAGTPIHVSATIADVSITGSDRTDISVAIVRHAPSDTDLARYPAAIEARADGIYITADQAGDGRDANLKTEITIAAPAGARFQAIRIFEGRVRLTNLTGACDVDLRRGAVDAVRIAGRVRLEAGLGSIDVKEAGLTPGGMMRLRVFNGPLRVALARRPANARILALTFNGSITSDIPLTMKDRFGPRFGETTIGSGDPVMSLDVVKGDITITAK